MFAMICRRLLLVHVAVLNLQATSARAQDPAFALQDSVMRIVEQAEPSVVSIARVRPVPADPTLLRLLPHERMRLERKTPPSDSDHPDFQPNDFGAGIILAGKGAEDRLVLTNYHVVRGGPVFPSIATEDNTSIDVRFSDRRGCKGSIIAADPRSDLAMLHLHLNDTGIAASDIKGWDLTSSASPVIRKGMFVVMLGNPYALARDGSASVSWGMISNIARRPLPRTEDPSSAVILYRLGNLMQIDGRLNLGTSGGPVIGLKGELLGMTTSLASVDGYDKSAGFAIPFDEYTRRIVKTLAAGHEVEYGMLGINQPSDVLPRDLRARNISGVTQASAAIAPEVAIGSPAERAGLRRGDIILRVVDETILSHHDLMRIVGLHAPESEVDLLICHERQSEPTTVKVRLGKWPVQDDEGIVETKPRFEPWRGMSVDYPTGRSKYLREERMISAYRQAVVVTRVAEGSAARNAGLQPGDFIAFVNRTPVQTPSEFYAAVKNATGKVTLKHMDGKVTIVAE